MSGEVTNNPTFIRYAELQAKLSDQVKNGKTTLKEAQQALLEFRKENQLGEYAVKTTADAETEAKEAAGAAMGFQRSTTPVDTAAEDSTTPAAEEGTNPAVEEGTNPAAEEGTKPAAEEGTKPAAEEGTKPAAEEGTKPAAEEGTKPAAEEGTKPAAEEGTKPAAEEGTKPAAEEGNAPAAEKKELTQMQELLLKQAHEKYPDNTVELDKNGKIVVKDKQTGEIDEAKTEEAKQIKVETGTADVTIEEGKARPDVKLTLPTEDSVKKMKQYDSKKEAHEEFTTGTKAAAEEAKAKLEQKKEEIKQLEKEMKELDKSGNYKAAAAKAKELSKLSKELQGLQNDYDNAKAISSKKGDRGIARAAKRNAKNFDRLGGENEKARQVFLSKDQEEAYLREHPEDKDHTVVLSQKQRSTLTKSIGYAQAYIELAEEDVANATDPASKAEAEAKLKNARALYGDLATCMDDEGNIDAKKLKEGLLVFSGADGRFNIDEKNEVAKKFGLKTRHVRSLAKELGFGDESATAKRFGAAGAAMAATALASLIGPHKQSATSSAHSEVTTTATETVTDVAFDEQTSVEIFKYMDQSGNLILKDISATAKAQATATATATTSATAIADAVATATAKIPVFGQVAGPVVAGITAFIIANPQSKDAFNGNSVEHVLENLNAVSGKDNKKIVANIQNMEITGDPVRDKAIKAAVIQAALGGESAKANTEELLSAYQMLVDTKDAIEKIENREEPPVTPPAEEPPVTPPAEEPPVTPPPAQEPCRDIQERSTHGDVIPSRDVRGHGQSPYWIANAYINQDGTELNAKQRKALQKELSKEDNKQVREDGNFNGSRIGYRYRKEITLPDGTVVKLAPTEEIADRIGKGEVKKVDVTNGKEGKQYRVVTVDCNDPSKIISAGPWKNSIEEAEAAVAGK